MKKGEDRKSCFVLITHSQSPSSKLGSATGHPGSSDISEGGVRVATSASTAALNSSLCAARYDRHTGGLLYILDFKQVFHFDSPQILKC